MGLDPRIVDQLVALVREQFPDWAGFDHQGFRHDERDYKVTAVEKAIGPDGLLSESALLEDLDGHAFNSFIERFDKIGHATNLLYQSVPMSGDLNALYHAREKSPEVWRLTVVPCSTSFGARARRQSGSAGTSSSSRRTTCPTSGLSRPTSSS